MKKFLFVFFICISNILVAQNELFFLYKSDWSDAKDMKEATYFMHMLKENDTAFVCRYYNVTGPMLKMETYQDRELTIPKGRFSWYNQNGWLDSTGFVYHGRKDGIWYYMDIDSAHIVVREEYIRGKFQKRIDYRNEKITNADGTSEPLDKPKPKDDNKQDSVIQIEATFRNGLKDWKLYLMKNMKTPERFINLANGYKKASPMVSFNIDKEGNVVEVQLVKTAEWSVDMEALRVIKNSPKWTPATQDGKPVIYRQRQSLTFVVEE